MVDPRARTRFAEAIRALVAGRITNDAYEDVRLPALDTADDAIIAIHDEGVWRLYSDLHEHRLIGEAALSRQQKAAVARWLLFLRTDLDYAWPRLGGLPLLALSLANVATLGMAGRAWRQRFARHGCLEAWPFLRQGDLDAACRSVGYCGMKQAPPPLAGPA